ncbi:MAG: hypothetical protein JWO08_2682 [Verrucomicrobiaceae bacterium]|nr:hypothetical protein [Verrucomicrobiaceae bacterium]
MLPDELEFEESLLKKIQDMQPNRTFFKLIRDTGGSAELFIGLFPDGANIGTTLPHDLLTAAGDLGLDLALDIYNPK